MKHKKSVISIALATIMLISLCTVVCSASVTAADSSRKTVQAPATVGAALDSTPAIAIWKKAGPGDSFGLGFAAKSSTSNQPYFMDFDVGGPWVALGGATSDAPRIASGTPTQMVVSVRGTNGALYWKQTTDKAANWLPSATGWNKVPTGSILPGTSPAVYAFSATSIGWLVCGMDHQLYAMRFDGTYHGWTKLGGYVTATPAVVTRGTSIDVYVRGNNGANGHIYQKSNNNGAWQTTYAERTTATNVKAGTSPTASAYGTTREDLFWQGTDGLLYQTTWTQGNQWTAAAAVPTLGTTVTSSPSAAAGTQSSVIDIELGFVGGFAPVNGDLMFASYFTYDAGTPPTWMQTQTYGTGPP